MRNKKTMSLIAMMIICIAAILIFTGCGAASDNHGNKTEKKAPEIKGLTFSVRDKLDYAEEFDIFRYEDGYIVIDTHEEGKKYLVVPAGKDVPEDLDDSIIVIEQPVANIYLAATSSMSLFDAADGLEHITMTSVNADGWTVDAAVNALKTGEMTYAGKYNQPDYEMILNKNCRLAIESTMIYHNPEVIEMFGELGIPVFVDRSSYESNPLGRTEWIKIYGILTGNEEEALEYFKDQ